MVLGTCSEESWEAPAEEPSSTFSDGEGRWTEVMNSAIWERVKLCDEVSCGRGGKAGGPLGQLGNVFGVEHSQPRTQLAVKHPAIPWHLTV